MKLKIFATFTLIFITSTSVWALSPEAQALFDSLKAETSTTENPASQMTEPSIEPTTPKSVPTKPSKPLNTPPKGSTSKSKGKSSSKGRAKSSLSSLSVSLIDAATCGTANEVRQLLSAGADVNVRDSDGELLKKVMRIYEPEYFEMLEREKAQSIAMIRRVFGNKNSSAAKEAIAEAEKQFDEMMEQPNDYDWTPLMFAAACNPSVEVIDELLKAGANVNAVSKYGGTSLTAAATQNTVEVIKRLMNAGADINRETVYVREYGNSSNPKQVTRLEQSNFPLISAAGRNTPEVVEMLLNSGARVNIVTKDGRTPLEAAAASNKFGEVIDVLVRAGAKFKKPGVDRSRYVPEVYMAARHNTSAEIIEALARAGANVNEPFGLFFETPLFGSLRNPAQDRSIEIAQALLNAGANINVSTINENDGSAMTPLMMVRAHGASAAMINLIERAENDVKARDQDGGLGLTILESPRPNKNSPGVNFIPVVGWIAQGIENHESIKDSVRRAAAFSGSNSMEGILQEFDGDINQVFDDSTTLLMIAARNSYGKGSIEDLVTHGADLEMTNKNGLTPLMFAAKYNPSPETIWTLIGMGANLDAVDNNGRRAVDLARQNRNPVIADALQTAQELGLYNIFDAAIYGKPHEIKRMVQAGANVNALYSGEYANQEGANALYLIGNILGIASSLSGSDRLSAGSGLAGLFGDMLMDDKRYVNWTPLMLAVGFNEDPNAVQTLIDMGADVNAKAAGDVTAMSIAQQQGNADIIAMLKKAGA